MMKSLSKKNEIMIQENTLIDRFKDMIWRMRNPDFLIVMDDY